MKGPDSSAARTTSEQHADVITSANSNSPSDTLPLQSPRLLTRQQAAAYYAITPDTFDDCRRRGMVANPTWPQEEQVTRCNIYTGPDK